VINNFLFSIKDFVLYYKRQIDSQIHRIGRWVLQPAHNISRVDTNASESFNCVLKRLQEWKSVPLDVIAHGCEHLCRFYNVELLRGRYDLGTYRVRPELKHLYCRANDKPVFPNTIAPEEIVNNLEVGLSKVQQEVGYISLLK
jgi:hypothetical protein